MPRETKTFIEELLLLGYPIDANANPAQIAGATEALHLSSKIVPSIVILPRKYDSQWVLSHPRDAELLALAQLRPRVPLLLPPTNPELKEIFWSNPASLIRFDASNQVNKARSEFIYRSIDFDAIEKHIVGVCRQLSLPFRRSPWPHIFEEARAIIKC